VKPADNLVFAAGLLRFRRLAQPLGLGANLVFPGQDLFGLLGVQAEPPKIEAFVSINAQFLQNAGGRALRCRRGIVELVGQIARKFAQRIQLFRLLLHPCDFAHPIQKNADHPLRKRGMALIISGKRDRSNSSHQVAAEV
jgi:hypothetical protein